jgi:hypothetical protein
VEIRQSRRHELAEMRGAADKYYGRPRNPHIWLDNLGRNIVVEQDMTPEEIENYEKGYSLQTDRKEY